MYVAGGAAIGVGDDGSNPQGNRRFAVSALRPDGTELWRTAYEVIDDQRVDPQRGQGYGGGTLTTIEGGRVAVVAYVA